MIDVVPACIPINYRELEEKASLVKGVVKLMQFDVADGRYAPSKTWPYVRDPDPDFDKLLAEESGLPYWEEINYEVDLLVSRPEEKIEAWIHAGVTGAVVHAESTDRLVEAIEKAKYYDIKIGLALKPSTPNEAVTPFVEEIDFVQFMGNDRIGFNGVELDRKVLKKIREMRKEYPDIDLAIDIGVNGDTAPDLIDAGITKLVSGSAIFESADVEGTIEYFQSL